MKKLSLCFLFIFLSSCSSGVLADDRDCYFSDDSEGGFYLIFDEEGTPQPNLKITGPNDEDPVVVYGPIENGYFLYPDGHKMYFDEERAWGSEGSLIEDIEALAIECPAF